MTTSLEAAFDLFSKWKQDSLKVRVDLTAGKPGLPDNPLTIRAHLTGSVIAVDPSNAPGTVTVQGDNCGLELDLRGCRFSRRKPSDPPEFGVPLLLRNSKQRWRSHYPRVNTSFFLCSRGETKPFFTATHFRLFLRRPELVYRPSPLNSR